MDTIRHHQRAAERSDRTVTSETLSRVLVSTDDLKGFPGPLALRDEKGIEAFYTLGLTPRAILTAELQIIEPAIGACDTDVILGLRPKITERHRSGLACG